MDAVVMEWGGDGLGGVCGGLAGTLCNRERMI